jgi:hypothetical protein
LSAPRWRRDSERRSKALKLTSGKAGRTDQKRQPTLNDPRKFKAPYNPKERIWQEADRLRAAHPAAGPLRIGWGEGGQRPGEVSSCIVKVLDLAEFDLHLDLVPVNGLREQLDIDALLMGDLKSILVDKRAFMSPRLEYRLRFSVAHESAISCPTRPRGAQHDTSCELQQGLLRNGCAVA